MAEGVFDRAQQKKVRDGELHILRGPLPEGLSLPMITCSRRKT